MNVGGSYHSINVSKKKILIVDFNGSSPTYTYYFSSAFKKSGVNVKIIGHKNLNDLSIHPKLIDYIGAKTGWKYLDYILNWMLLLLSAKNYNAIHVQWLPLLQKSSFELLLISMLKKRNRNLFYTVHNTYPHNSKGAAIFKRYDRLYNLLDNLVVHTDETARRFSNMYPHKRIIKINHGLFYSGFAKEAPSDSKLMVMLGMILPYKGFEDAIEIVHKIRAKGLDFRLHIEGAGSKEYIEKLSRLAAELELNNSVTIQEGYVHIERLIGLYNLAFVTLMPYKRIEQSGVACTSLGLKVPVVSYDVGGIKEVIKDKINGRIVPLNDIEAFCDAIVWTSHNRELLQSNLSQKYYSDYWDQNAKILLSEYFISENESK